MNGFYFMGTVFAWLVVLMFVIGEIRPSEHEWVQEDVGAVDMTPWKLSGVAGVALIACVIGIYAWFADFDGAAKASKAQLEATAQVEQASDSEDPVAGEQN